MIEFTATDRLELLFGFISASSGQLLVWECCRQRALARGTRLLARRKVDVIAPGWLPRCDLDGHRFA